MSLAPIAVFRCDASAHIGAGHVVRCMALADVLKEAGWQIVFATDRETVETVTALKTSGHKIQLLDDKSAEVEILHEAAFDGADLLAIDHYGRDVVFEQECRSFVRSILAFDDGTGRHHDCDIIVDAAAAGASDYANLVPRACEILAGPNYALVRSSFLARRQEALQRRDGRPVENILVSCGATDPHNITMVALDALAQWADRISITVLLSSRAPNVDMVRERLRGRAILILDAEDMAEFMTNADIAIGASGSTTYERAVLGLPSIMVTIAENQRGIARCMFEKGAAVDGGEPGSELSRRLTGQIENLILDAPARRRLAEASSALVDGRGAMRVVLALLGEGIAKSGARVRLRLASSDDESWLLNIQQQPETRRYFRNSVIPTADEHREWMKRTLADPERLLLIVEADGQPVGFTRLDRQADEGRTPRYELSIAIEPESQNRGIGAAALRLLPVLMPGVVFNAAVLAENNASRALFGTAGFEAISNNTYRLGRTSGLS